MNFDKTKIFSIHFMQVWFAILSRVLQWWNQSSDQATRSSQPRRASHQLSTKPLPIPTPPTIETPKTPKVRARMLQNALTQIGQGQTVRSKRTAKKEFFITHLLFQLQWFPKNQSLKMKVIHTAKVFQSTLFTSPILWFLIRQSRTNGINRTTKCSRIWSITHRNQWRIRCSIKKHGEK